jgi:hypothetical protein
MTFTEKQSTETLPDGESTDARICIYTAAIGEQKCDPIVVSMATQCEADVLNMDQCFTALVDAIGALYHPQMVTSESNMRTDGYVDAKNRSSHYCPKSRQGTSAIDDYIESFGTPHTTVSQQAEHVTMRHSHCNDVEIERIWMSLTTASQQAE